MAKELEKLLRERELINKKLAGKLDELAQRLAAGRKQFGERATQPLEYLEAVFPLIVDQERFVMLVLWQQDLAERLSSLKGRDGEDSPSAKARMREYGAGAAAGPQRLGHAVGRHSGAQREAARIA